MKEKGRKDAHLHQIPCLRIAMVIAMVGPKVGVGDQGRGRDRGHRKKKEGIQKLRRMLENEET